MCESLAVAPALELKNHRIVAQVVGVMKAHFEQFAGYNHWANARLYQAAFALSDADYRRDVGAFFKSMHGTLNHLLVADRIWLKRLTGQGDHPDRLDGALRALRGRSAAKAGRYEKELQCSPPALEQRTRIGDT
jgi:uncharacterized damage-inducible protein DinB